MKNLYDKIMPFIMMGVALVIIFYGLVLLAYLFVFGAVIGIILFVAVWFKTVFFPSRTISVSKRVGRIIEHDE